jgi:hypothetical protein
VARILLMCHSIFRVRTCTRFLGLGPVLEVLHEVWVSRSVQSASSVIKPTQLQFVSRTKVGFETASVWIRSPMVSINSDLLVLTT